MRTTRAAVNLLKQKGFTTAMKRSLKHANTGIDEVFDRKISATEKAFS